MSVHSASIAAAAIPVFGASFAATSRFGGARRE
jgi:hypothetical protein